MKKLLIFAICLLILIPLSAQSYQKHENRKRIKCADIQLPIYELRKATQPFVVLGKINAEASSPQMLSCKIRRAALNHNANAVLAYKINDQTATSMWTGSTMHTGCGIAVRWAKAGEHGMSNIASDYPVPVLQ